MRQGGDGVNDLIDTTEMYLRTILELEEEGVAPLRARIAERLHQSGPTVSQTVARMERDGLLTVEGDRHLALTATGRHRATSVMRKHRLAECLLVQVIGLEYDHAHVEACRWEHVMSDEVEWKVYQLLGHPTVSPYGNPIPGLAELAQLAAAPAGAHRQLVASGPARSQRSPQLPDGAVVVASVTTRTNIDGGEGGPGQQARAVTAAGSATPGSPTAPGSAGEGLGDEAGSATVPLAAIGAVGAVVIGHLSELLQNDVALVNELDRAGVRPGATVRVQRDREGFVLDAGAAPVRVPLSSARLVFVSAS
jgi:DtxR family Mn-dependent transcriptional regulator